MRIFSLFLILFFNSTLFCSASEKLKESAWAIEPSLTFPLNRIYMVNMAYSLSVRNELLFGIAFQNWKNQIKKPIGNAHAYTLVVGYRYYVWKGLNIEIMLFPAYNNFKSYVDNKWYNGFELWNEYRVGYKFKWSINSRQFNINVQPGIGHGTYMQHIWPDLSKNYVEFIKESFSFIPQIALGIKF